MNRSFTVTTFLSPYVNKDKRSEPDNEVWGLLAKDLRAGAKPGRTHTHTKAKKKQKFHIHPLEHISFHKKVRGPCHNK